MARVPSKLYTGNSEIALEGSRTKQLDVYLNPGLKRVT